MKSFKSMERFFHLSINIEMENTKLCVVVVCSCLRCEKKKIIRKANVAKGKKLEKNLFLLWFGEKSNGRKKSIVRVFLIPPLLFRYFFPILYLVATFLYFFSFKVSQSKSERWYLVRVPLVEPGWNWAWSFRNPLVTSFGIDNLLSGSVLLL